MAASLTAQFYSAKFLILAYILLSFQDL